MTNADLILLERSLQQEIRFSFGKVKGATYKASEEIRDNVSLGIRQFFERLKAAN